MTFYRALGTLRLMALLLMLLPAVVSAGPADDRMMIATVDMTPAGRKLVPASKENPVYFLPVVLGYRELGDPVRDFERKPDEREVRRMLEAGLAKRGYLVASKEHRPTLVLVFEWGSIAPVLIGDRQGNDPGFAVNGAEIRGYVLGTGGKDLSRSETYYTEMSSLAARHFLLISAFEYRKPEEKGEVLLWRAHITTELWGNFLGEVMPVMIRHAGPVLGRETKPGPAWSSAIPNVTVGTPTVVRDPPADGK